jgi:hypothetical protein
VLGVEGELTGDGRLIAHGGLRWDSSLPIPLRAVWSDVGAHDGAEVVGRVLLINRGAGGLILGEGDWDLASPAGRRAARMNADGLLTGVSLDLDDVSFEVRVDPALLEAEPAPSEPVLVGEGDEDAPPLPTAEDGRVVVHQVSSDEEVMVMTSGRIRAATLVAIPAFARAQIAPATVLAPAALDPAAVPSPDEEEDEPAPPSGEEESADALVAAAAAVGLLHPPREWFEAPRLSAPTALTVTHEGRVYGHLAAWGTCHIAHGHSSCVTPPRSSSRYAYFRTGTLLCEDGSEVAVGSITLGTGHASGEASARRAMAHYDNTGAAVADVAVGEDEHGIWIAGALRPSVTPEQVRVLRASPLSGDWRRIGSSLELVAALAVNVPGFPVPRPSGLIASGHLQTLTASGMLPPRTVVRPGLPGALSLDDLRYLKRLAQRERERERLAASSPSPSPSPAPAAVAAVPQAVAALARSRQAAALATRVRTASPVPALAAASGASRGM